MARTYVNEGTTSHHPFAISDVNGDPVTPEALRYRVTARQDVDIVAWSTLATSATEIVVPAAKNTIGSEGKRRYITIEATHNGGEIITAEIEYTLVDLKGV